MNIAEQVQDLQRRIRAIKANRPTTTSQVDDLEYSQTFAITLAPAAYAVFSVTVVCGGPPIADVSISGLTYGDQQGTMLSRQNIWTISGNTATCSIQLRNYKSTADIRNVTITAYALNGLSATIVRTQ